MIEFSRPRVVVSQCLGKSPCRYNGQASPYSFINDLQNHADITFVCPEVEIGLGIPREPIRIVHLYHQNKLFQPATERDLTTEMINFSNQFLNSIKASDLDGFILKSRSPSCGIKDVKVYHENGLVKEAKSKGFFGGHILENFPYTSIEDEGRLSNFTIRGHFLIKLFTIARLKQIKKSQSFEELRRFLLENRLLLMSYNQTRFKRLEKLVTNEESKNFKEVIVDFERELVESFNRTAKFTAHVNVLLYAMSYFSDALKNDEKAYFLDLLEKYRTSKIPLSALLSVLRSWVIRFEREDLMDQTYFSPFPEELMAVTDSGKGREV